LQHQVSGGVLQNHAGRYRLGQDQVIVSPLAPLKTLTMLRRYAEHRYEGISQVGQAISDVQRGKNKAKAVIIVADH
jgi:hypothetical protein